MEKICFDKNDKIIGFNLKKSLYHVNLFYLHGINKQINKTRKINATDSLGRQLYYKIDSNNVTSYIDETKKSLYKPFLIDKNYVMESYLTYEPNQFNLQDIINIKKNQLLENFKCKECILDELLNDNIFKFDGIQGKNFIRIINDNIISQCINLNNNKNIAIYYESDNDIKIDISYDGITYVEIEKEKFINYEYDSIFLKLKSPIETNIYSICILIN